MVTQITNYAFSELNKRFVHIRHLRGITPNCLRIWKIPVKGFASFVRLGFSTFVTRSSTAAKQ
jgi:hypothetical protein